MPIQWPMCPVTFSKTSLIIYLKPYNYILFTSKAPFHKNCHLCNSSRRLPTISTERPLHCTKYVMILCALCHKQLIVSYFIASNPTNCYFKVSIEIYGSRSHWLIIMCILHFSLQPASRANILVYIFQRCGTSRALHSLPESFYRKINSLT